MDSSEHPFHFFGLFDSETFTFLFSHAYAAAASASSWLA